MNKNITIGVLAVIALLFLGLYIAKTATINIPVQPIVVGGSSGTTHTSAEVFLSSLTASCAKVYLTGATTNSSSTYYIVASSTVGGASVGNGYPMFATSTKPTNCGD